MKYLLTIFTLALCFSGYAQFDDQAFDFKRNAIRIGYGSQSSSNFSVKYVGSDGVSPGSRDVEIEYGRQLNRNLSSSVLYRLVDYNLGRYIHKEHQRQINLFYAPFSFFHRIVFKMGMGLTHTTINQVNHTNDEIPGFTNNVSSKYHWGGIGIVELNCKVIKELSLGIKGFKQISLEKTSPFGAIVKLGYSF